MKDTPVFKEIVHTLSAETSAAKPLLMPVPYLPRVSWFVTLLSNSEVSWHTTEIYDKRQPRNRCVIATAHGAQQLSVPLVNGRNQRIGLDKVQPLYNGRWQREHIHAMQTAYGRTPYFQYYADELFERINTEHENLASLNVSLIRLLLKNFNIVVHEHSISATRPFEKFAGEIKLSGLFQYQQAFSDRTGFISGCSAVDLLFNHGPDSVFFLNKASVS